MEVFARSWHATRKKLPLPPRRRINCNDGRTVKAGLFYVRRHTCADGSFEWYVLNGHTRRPASKLFRTRAAAAAERARLQVKLELAGSKSLSERRDADRPPKYCTAAPAGSGRCTLRKGEMQSENQSPVAAFLFCGALAVTPLDQLRLRLPAHDFDRLMQAAKPVAEAARDAMLKDIAAELGQHEVVGPGLLHRIISEVQRRCDVADQRRTTAQKREDPGWM